GHGWSRTAEDVRAKWRDYASVTKRKAAALRREQQRTGGGRSTLPPLTPDEERVLAILGPEVLDGVPGGIDVCGMHTSQTSTPHPSPLEPSPSGPLQSDPQGPSTSGTATTSTVGSLTPSQGPSTLGTARHGHQALRAALSPAPPESPQSGSSATHSAASPQRHLHTQARRRRKIHCQCSEELLKSEGEKISILRGIREELAALREQNERHHEETMAYRREKLALLAQQASRPSVAMYPPPSESSFYEVLGDGLGLSKASISRAVTAVTQVLLQLDKRITFPKTPEDIARVNQGFHAIADIPQVIGVIDGTLVPIARPSNNEAVYLCRKGYQALNIQVVCDYQGLFTDIVAKWPGSTHDAFMWANSALCRVAEGGGFEGCWLLGDSGYPLRPCLLTPIQQPNTEAEERYNSAHTRTRAVVERAIGLWKQRFRCLSKSAGGLQLNPTKSCAVVVVTALLHNTALRANVQLPDDEENSVEDTEDDYLLQHDGMHPAGLEQV
ncbi:hypothetical protein NFI96_009634, partial [Prochilodus magdalenae]